MLKLLIPSAVLLALIGLALLIGLPSAFSSNQDQEPEIKLARARLNRIIPKSVEDQKRNGGFSELIPKFIESDTEKEVLIQQQQELIKKVILLREKSRKLKKKLSDRTNSPSANKKLADLQKKLQELKKNNELARKRLNSINSDSELRANFSLSDELRELQLALLKEKERVRDYRTQLESIQQEERSETVSTALVAELKKELNLQVARADKLEKKKRAAEGKLKAMQRFQTSRRRLSDKVINVETEAWQLKEALHDKNLLKKENAILREEVQKQRKQLDALQNAASEFLSVENSLQQPLEAREFIKQSAELNNSESEPVDIAKLQRRQKLVAKLRESFAEDELKRKSKPGTAVFTKRDVLPKSVDELNQLDF